MQYLRLIPLFAFTLLIFSCKNESNQEKTNEEIPSMPLPAVTPETKEKINYVINDIPSPVEIAIIINEAGFIFNSNLLNPLTNLGHYSNNNLKALNLGVYGADLAYLVEYSQSQTALKYLASCKQMSEEMGVTSAFDKSMIGDFEKNISEKDSLMNLIYPAYKRVDDYLRNNERAYMATLVLAGGFLEGMYFTTQLLNNVPKDDKNSLLYQKLSEQKNIIKRLIELLNERKDDADFAKLLKSFSSLQDIYSSLGDNELSQKEVAALNGIIINIRNEMVLK